MKRVQILIADDHELVRDGIKARVEAQPDWQVCAEAKNGREAVELVRQFKPAVAVLDIGMPELNGLMATELIRKTSPATHVLMLTMQESDDLIREAFAAGARGFVLKTDTSQVLVTAIQTLLEGKLFFTSNVSQIVFSGFSENPRGFHAIPQLSALTTRETEIVRLLAAGSTSKQAALRLGVSVSTVEAHRANVMRKFKLGSVADLVRFAIRQKLVEP